MTLTDTAPNLDPGPIDPADTAGIPATADTTTELEGHVRVTTGADSEAPDARATVATVQALPELVHVDPATLIVSANVRAEVHLDKPFIASIRDQGVLVPIVARRRNDQLQVVLGQRRTLGAVEAGRALVPVYIVDALDEGAAADVVRIVRQIIENDHREALSDTDRVRAHQQLSLLGLSAGQIARRTRTGLGGIKASLTVASSEHAAAAMARYDLTLDQAGVLAEFEDDTEAVKTLTVTAKKDPGQFAHLAQRLRDKRAEDAARAALLEKLATEGTTVIETPGYGDRRIAKLRDLKVIRPTSPAGAPAADSSAEAPAQAAEATERVDVDSAVTTEMTPDAHSGCPGHAAYLEDRGRWSTGEPVVAVYVCTDWQRHGHESRYAQTLTGGSATGGKMTEDQKAERRVVVANNKAWDSAQVVRREWLKAFLARRTAPKDAPQWIAVTLAGCGYEVRRAMEDGHALALELLGLAGERPWSPYGGRPNPVAVATQTATPGRATVLSLGLLLGGLEASTSRSSWRAPVSSAHSAYFTALQAWGYGLSEVEQLVIPVEKPRSRRSRGARTTGGSTGTVGEAAGATEDQSPSGGEHVDSDAGTGTKDSPVDGVDADASVATPVDHPGQPAGPNSHETAA